MNKLKWLWTLLIICMLSNGLLLWRSFAPHPHHGRREHQPKHRIIEALQLDQEQCKAYADLIQQHRSAVDALEQELLHARAEIYVNLPDSAVANPLLVQKVIDVQAQLEQVHFAHFKAIRALCKPEQLHRFDALTVEFPALFSPHAQHR